MNNPQLLIDAIVQQTMVFIAHLATTGGVRAPLAGLANQIFLDLNEELKKQGVKQKVIADMFGMALRTYHRKSQELRQSRTDEGRTVWEAVFAYLKERGRVPGAEILHRFRNDDLEVVTGILGDLVATGLVYRTGRGNLAVYKIADDDEFDSLDQSRAEANVYLVWLTVYRHGPLTDERVVELTRLKPESCQSALTELIAEGKVRREEHGDEALFHSDKLDVPLGTTQGWEAAVLDHYQAVIGAISNKLTLGPTREGQPDQVGGSTWSLDVWSGHPLEAEAKSTLQRVRGEVEALRARIDAHNAAHPDQTPNHRVVVYVGQDLRSDEL